MKTVAFAFLMLCSGGIAIAKGKAKAAQDNLSPPASGWTVVQVQSSRPCAVFQDGEPIQLKVWFDKARLAPGFNWHHEIEQGCENSRVILPVLTPRWKNSDWTKFETYGAEAVIQHGRGELLDGQAAAQRVGHRRGVVLHHE